MEKSNRSYIYGCLFHSSSDDLGDNKKYEGEKGDAKLRDEPSRTWLTFAEAGAEHVVQPDALRDHDAEADAIRYVTPRRKPVIVTCVLVAHRVRGAVQKGVDTVELFQPVPTEDLPRSG